MLRAVALRFESGAITSTSTPSSSRSARRAACRPGAEIPSSLVRRTRTRRDSRWRAAGGILPPWHTVRLDIEYDGAGFRGWARQPGLRTVQGELEAALATVLREPVELTVAGRTDTGVHALGQVASFETAAELPARPGPRGSTASAPTTSPSPPPTVVADGFDARRDATLAQLPLPRPGPLGAEPLRARPGPLVAAPLDREALDACAAALPGTHDFTAFTPTQTDHVRFERDVLAASWSQEGDVAHLPHHRRRLHAQHGPRPRRHHAGGRLRPPHPRELHRSSSRAPPAPQAAKPPRPTASTWSPSLRAARWASARILRDGHSGLSGGSPPSALDQLEINHLGGVRLRRAELDDPGVPARPLA